MKRRECVSEWVRECVCVSKRDGRKYLLANETMYMRKEIETE